MATSSIQAVFKMAVVLLFYVFYVISGVTLQLRHVTAIALYAAIRRCFYVQHSDNITST